jgi:hypothetical protein
VADNPGPRVSRTVREEKPAVQLDPEELLGAILLRPMLREVRRLKRLLRANGGGALEVQLRVRQAAPGRGACAPEVEAVTIHVPPGYDRPVVVKSTRREEVP